MTRLALFTAVLLLAGGCSPAGPVFLPVTGRVLYDGKPLTTGRVIFRPDAGRGNGWSGEANGELNDQGSYTLKSGDRVGVPAGWYTVVVFSMKDPNTQKPPEWLIPTRYTDPTRSGLWVEVKDNQGPEAYEVRLTP